MNIQKLKLFGMVPPDSAPLHMRDLVNSQILDGAILLTSDTLAIFGQNPGSINLCPICLFYFATWNSSTRQYTCDSCAHIFTDSEALRLVFGHLAPF